VCRTKGCESKPHAKGYCKKHFERLKLIRELAISRYDIPDEAGYLEEEEFSDEDLSYIDELDTLDSEDEAAELTEKFSRFRDRDLDFEEYFDEYEK